MPKLKPPENELRDDAVREALGRAMGKTKKSDEDMGICIMATRRTFQNRRKRPEKFTLKEIRLMDKVLKFTDEEIVSMVRGRR
ncbi:MAG: hypothetical protein Q4C66_05260 [Lachnospiraceae bacterium]|nr:hypothetical protein [Lachnospiraceae bacterium]